MAGNPQEGPTGDAGSTRGRRSAVSEVLTLVDAVVHGHDHERVGRVQDVYLTDREGELAAVGVRIGRFVPRVVIVPAELLELHEDGSLEVDAPAERIREAPEAPVTGHLRPLDLDAARAALEEGSA